MYKETRGECQEDQIAIAKRNHKEQYLRPLHQIQFPCLSLSLPKATKNQGGRRKLIDMVELKKQNKSKKSKMDYYPY